MTSCSGVGFSSLLFVVASRGLAAPSSMPGNGDQSDVLSSFDNEGLEFHCTVGLRYVYVSGLSYCA